MSHIVVIKERVINASATKIYGVLADYRNQRPKILTLNFLDYVVEKGGQGAGTVVSYILQVANRRRQYRMRVEEPVKGGVITEHDHNSSLVTTWVLSPLGNGQTRVSVASEWQGGKGVGGFFERTFAPMGLRRVYDEMLALLAQQTQSNGQMAVQEQSSPKPLALAAVAVLALILGISLARKLRS